MSAPVLTVVFTPQGAPATDSLLLILRQGAVGEVVIVGDAGSTRWAAADPRVRFVGWRGSLGAARNDGLGAARGRYVAFVDATSLVTDGAYDALVGSLEESGSDLATGPVVVIGDQSPRRAAVPTSADAVRHTNLADDPALVADRDVSNKVFRRSFLTSQAIRWPEGVDYCDLAAVTRAQARALGIDVVTRPVVHTRPGTAPGRPRDWLTQTTRAFSSLTTDGSRSAFAAMVLADEAAVDSAALLDPDDGERASAVIRSLLECVPDHALAALPPRQRWELTLLALGRPELVRLVSDPDDRETVALDGLDEPLPAPLLRGLGLGDETVSQAFARRFLRGPGGGRAGEVVPGPDDTPEVSVIIAVEADDDPGELLKTVSAAVGVRLEIVVVGAPSSPSAVADLARHAAEDSRIRLVEGEATEHRRNRGVRLARGEYLAFAQPGDLVPPNSYAAMLEAARRTGAQLVIGDFLRFASTSTAPADAAYCYSIELDCIGLTDLPALVLHRACWNRLARRDFWQAHAGAFSDAPRLDDIVAVTSALAAAERITVVPDVSYIKRVRPGGPSDEAAASAWLAGYLTEELGCAEIVGRLGDQGVAATYWDHTLGHDLWHHAATYLPLHPADDPEVVRLLDDLLALAPEPALLRQAPEAQALIALLRRGNLAAAATLMRAARAQDVALGDGLDALAALTDDPGLGARELSSLAWRLLVAPLAGGPGSVTPELAEQAVSLARRLATRGGTADATPGTAEGRVNNALLAGSAVDLLAVLADKPAKARLRLRPTRAVLTGKLDPALTRYDAVIASQPGRAPLVLGTITTDATHWRASLDPDAVPRSGRWELLLQAEDAWGPVRRRLRAHTTGSAKVIGRLTRLGPTRPGAESAALWVRAAPVVRARRALGSLRRRLGR